MRKTLTLLVLIAFIFFSCNNEKKIIEEVAYHYSFAMGNYLVEDAEQYATEETKETTLAKAKILVKAINPEYITKDTPANLEITSIEITSDTTAIAVYHKTTPLKNFSGELFLVKRNNIWLVHDPLHIRESKSTNSKVENVMPFNVIDSIYEK